MTRFLAEKPKSGRFAALPAVKFPNLKLQISRRFHFPPRISA